MKKVEPNQLQQICVFLLFSHLNLSSAFISLPSDPVFNIPAMLGLVLFVCVAL